jgi:secondary thiamine-phosphate synthase enzyme
VEAVLKQNIDGVSWNLWLGGGRFRRAHGQRRVAAKSKRRPGTRDNCSHHVARHASNRMLGQFSTTIEVQTRGRGLFDISEPVRRWVRGCGLHGGLLTLFIRHTSASLLIQENAAPEVRSDLERFFARLVPDGDALYAHRDEGPDDMPAHVRAALTQTQLAVPLVDGELALGTWQGIYVYEHRKRAHQRQVVLHLIGE